MIDADRVVGRLRQLVQDAYAAAGHGSGCEHGGAEVFFADGLRARESEKNTSGLDFFESLDIEFAVALQGIAQSIAVLGKSRRVKNYQVLMGMGVKQGDTVTIKVEGDDEAACAEAIQKFLSENV